MLSLLVALLSGCGGAMRDGRLAMVRGDFEAAARAYRRATEETPDDPQAWLALGRAEMSAERYGRAREALRTLAQLRPRAPLPRVLIGNTWELSRRYDEALVSYRQAVAVAPRSAWASRVLGTRLLRWGRPEPAREALERSLSLDPEHAETWNALGMARYHTGAIAEAEEAFREGLERRPEHNGLRLGLAALLINQERYEAALTIYDELLARAPGFAPGHLGRGILLHELGREDEAEAAFVEAVRVARRPARFERRLEAYRRPQGPGQLTLITTVDGAEVLVDEDSIGFTPVEPIELEPGTHTVRLRRPGYTEFDEVVEIQAGQNTDLDVGMIALSMVLTVRSDPDEARVFVDDAFRGTTPLELELNEGEHEIRVVAPRYREQTQTVNAIAGETDLVSVELERIPDELLNPRALEWYEEPLTWGLIGGGVAVLVAVLAVSLYFGLQEDPVNAFCGEDDPNCIYIPSSMIEWRDAWTAATAGVSIPME